MPAKFTSRVAFVVAILLIIFVVQKIGKLSFNLGSIKIIILPMVIAALLAMIGGLPHLRKIGLFAKIQKYLNQVDFLAFTVPVLTFAGIAVADRLLELKNISYKIVIVARISNFARSTCCCYCYHSWRDLVCLLVPTSIKFCMIA